MNCRPAPDVALALDSAAPIELVVAALGNGSNISAKDTVALVRWCAEPLTCAREPGE